MMAQKKINKIFPKVFLKERKKKKVLKIIYNNS